MNEEIKDEKIEYILKKLSDGYDELEVWEYSYLEDYITNLQQKVALLRQENNDVRKAFNGLQQENERLELLKDTKSASEIINDVYKSRNEKAIEYINKNKQVVRELVSSNSGSMKFYELCIEPDNLLNILQGSDKE